MVNMKNNFIICNDDDETTVVSPSSATAFVLEGTDRFKTVMVTHSNEEDIPIGSRVKISVNAGEKDELGLIIRRTDIICIL